MTTPSVNIVNLPYGATVEGRGTLREATIVSDTPNKVSDTRLKIPWGPCRIVASWSGPEAVRVTQFGVGYPIELPAGDGIRSGTAVVGGKGEHIYLESKSNENLSNRGRGTIEVYPLLNQ